MNGKLLVIAPHPDDETLGAAGTILKALDEGKQVKVLFMTVGDGYYEAVHDYFGIDSPAAADYRRLGELRHQEAVAAMKELGIGEQNLIFLGYPDGGLDRLWESNWDYDRLYEGINGCRHAPYSFSYQQDADYCGANVVSNLTNILRAFNPTDVIYPDPNDQHNDHWATSAFVKYVLNTENFAGQQSTYIIHKGNFPVPWKYAPDIPLMPPMAMAGMDTQWAAVPLNHLQRKKKLSAILHYKSQAVLAAEFFKEFVRENELLGVYKDPVLKESAVFRDAADDLKLEEAGPGADITAVRVERTTDELLLEMHTQAEVSNQIRYNLRLRIFRPHGVSRLDLAVSNGQLTAEKLASNSLDLPANTKLEQLGNQLRMKLPAGIFQGAASVMLAADSYVGQTLADVTPWRLLFLFN